jgi:hypothetical protein
VKKNESVVLVVPTSILYKKTQTTSRRMMIRTAFLRWAFGCVIVPQVSSDESGGGGGGDVGGGILPTQEQALDCPEM